MSEINMAIEEAELRTLHDAGRLSEPVLHVEDSAMNLTLTVKVDGKETARLHTKRGGPRRMAPQTALNFVREVFGCPDVTVRLLPHRRRNDE